jgi:hypothetical protein
MSEPTNLKATMIYALYDRRGKISIMYLNLHEAALSGIIRVKK